DPDPVRAVGAANSGWFAKGAATPLARAGGWAFAPLSSEGGLIPPRGWVRSSCTVDLIISSLPGRRDRLRPAVVSGLRPRVSLAPGAVLRPESLEQGDDRLVVGPVDGLGHPLELGEEPAQLARPVHGPEDLRVGRRQPLLVAVVELLVELLAGPEPGEDDLDLAPLGQPREADQVPGQVEHLDRLAHVEPEDLTPLAQPAPLED